MSRVTELETILQDNTLRINEQDVLIQNLANGKSKMDSEDEFRQSDFNIGFITAN